MKIVGCLLITLGAASVGFRLSNGIAQEKKLLAQLHRALQILRNEIAFCGTPLPQAFSKMAFNCDGYLERICFAVSNGMDNHRWMTPDAVMEAVLRQEEPNAATPILSELALGIGAYDLEAQLNTIAAALQKVEALMLQAERDGKSKSKLYETLGICCGLSIAILLI